MANNTITSNEFYLTLTIRDKYKGQNRISIWDISYGCKLFVITAL